MQRDARSTKAKDLYLRIVALPSGLVFKNPIANPAHRPQQFRHFPSITKLIINRWFYERALRRVQALARTSGMTKRVALYLRVSTGEQTTTNQRLELEAWAARCGYTVTEVYEDHAISGAKSSDQRPALSRLLKDAVRRRFDTWWRRGRSIAWGAA